MPTPLIAQDSTHSGWQAAAKKPPVGIVEKADTLRNFAKARQQFHSLACIVNPGIWVIGTIRISGKPLVLAHASYTFAKFPVPLEFGSWQTEFFETAQHPWQPQNLNAPLA